MATWAEALRSPRHAFSTDCEQARRLDQAMFKKSNGLERRSRADPELSKHASCISALTPT